MSELLHKCADCAAETDDATSWATVRYCPRCVARQSVAGDSVELRRRIEAALDLAYGAQSAASERRLWIIDQMARALTGCPDDDSDDTTDEYADFCHVFERGGRAWKTGTP
jgi:hypothetical protein